jgi:predicted transcriptional regulator
MNRGETLMTSNTAKKSRIQSLCDLLVVIRSGVAKQTHIMYKANLTWEMTQDFLSTLENQALVDVISVDGKKFYTITPKGSELLRQYALIENELNITA